MTITTHRIETGRYDVRVNGQSIGDVRNVARHDGLDRGWLFSPNDAQGDSIHGDTKREVVAALRRSL